MARINHINPREYREPFLIVKTFINDETGLRTQTSYNSKLLYGSIIQTHELQNSTNEREAKETLSIKFLKPNLEIQNTDWIIRDNKIFNILNIDTDQFNLQEIKIKVLYVGQLTDNPELKKYVEFVNCKEIQRPLVLYLSLEQVNELMNNLSNEIKEIITSLENEVRQLKENEDRQ